ncbi:hypothetical protein ACLOJK_006421, partial [Asimina triloba]
MVRTQSEKTSSPAIWTHLITVHPWHSIKQPNTRRETEAKQRKKLTLVQQLLRGLVGIHVGLFEHHVDISIGVIAYNLFDGLDGFPDTSGHDLLPTIRSRATHHLNEGTKMEGMVGRKTRRRGRKTRKTLEAETLGRTWVRCRERNPKGRKREGK